MEKQILKDRKGNKIGSIEIRSDGIQIGKDKIGQGNLLSSLLTQL
jgi:hypothetical protein